MSDDFEKLVLGSGHGVGGAGAVKSDIPLFLQDDADAAKGHVKNDFLASLDAIPSSASAQTQAQAQATAAVGVAGVHGLSGNGATVPVLSSAEKLSFVAPRRSNAKGDAVVVVYTLERERILGKGNFGCATLYTNRGGGGGNPHNKHIVVKDINLQAMSSERDEEVDTLVNEAALLYEVRGHPNCLYIFDHFSSAVLASDATADSADQHVDMSLFRSTLLDKRTTMAYLLTEYCGGGDLAHKVEMQLMSSSSFASAPASTPSAALLQNERNKRYFSETFVASVAIQLLVALHFLHEDRKIIHRDVKPQNLFFRDDGVSLRLGDFGIAVCDARGGRQRIDYSSSQVTRQGARHMPSGKSGGGDKGKGNGSAGAGGVNRKQVKGTPFYMAPELFQESSSYAFAVDVWSAGVVLYELIALEKPFLSSSYQGLSQLVVAGRCQPLREREELRWGPSSASSPPSSSSSEDKYIYSKDLLDVVMSMLSVDPQLRPSARRLLKKSYMRKHLSSVPRSLLQSEYYKSVFGEEAIAAAVGACVFTGLAEVEEEPGVPLAMVSSSMPAEQPRGRSRDTPAEDEYEDDFESSDDE